MPIRTIDVELPTADFAEIYRTVDGIDLGIHFYQPADAKSPTPAVVFYFGGGWRSGSIGQFQLQADYLKQRGVTCCLVEYRIKSKHGVTPFACVEDGRSAMRYIREHASRLNIDVDRICASGGSAGGHVAANTAFAKNCDAANDNLAIDPTPAAMFLFNPVLDTVVESWQARSHNDTVNALLEDFGSRGVDVSPIHQVQRGLMPVTIVHGEDDVTVPFNQTTDFAQRMQDAGNDCHVIGYPGYGHGFFNYRDGKKPEAFIDTLERMDDFLVHLGWLDDNAFVKSYVASLEA
tara:strand:+ start:102 stop:974 length:873 start_codon:yes stop_codon:yes gene_type:complete